MTLQATRRPGRSSLYTLVLACAVALLGMAAAPSTADAQLLKKIREQAKAKADSVNKRVSARVLEETGEVVDSTAEKTARGADTVLTRTGAALDGAITKTERGVAALAGRKGSPSDRMAADLADGRATLNDLRFTDADAIDEQNLPALRALAELLRAPERDGAWLIEVHTARGDDADLGQARASRRAAAVKAALIDAGVSGARLFAMGRGGSAGDSATAGGAPAEDSVEIARMQ